MTDINIDSAAFLIQTLIVLALPLLLGMLFRHLAPRAAQRIQNPLAILSALALFAIIIITTTRLFPVFMALGIGIFFIVLPHNILAFTLGNLAGRAIKTDTASRRALTIEVGIQNTGLGMVILLTQFSGIGGASAVAGLWGLWHLIGGCSLAIFWRWRDAKTAK